VDINEINHQNPFFSSKFVALSFSKYKLNKNQLIVTENFWFYKEEKKTLIEKA